MPPTLNFNMSLRGYAPIEVLDHVPMRLVACDFPSGAVFTRQLSVGLRMRGGSSLRLAAVKGRTKSRRDERTIRFVECQLTTRPCIDTHQEDRSLP